MGCGNSKGSISAYKEENGKGAAKGGDTPSDLPAQYQGKPRRRGSVSAEVDKSKDVYIRRVYPKTDEQMDMLAKATANNFLFTELTPESMKEMFEVS